MRNWIAPCVNNEILTAADLIANGDVPDHRVHLCSDNMSICLTTGRDVQMIEVSDVALNFWLNLITINLVCGAE